MKYMCLNIILHVYRYYPGALLHLILREFTNLMSPSLPPLLDFDIIKMD